MPADIGAVLPAGIGGIFTPLFQINLLPDLTHVNVLPDATEVIPALLHLAPALAAAFAGIRGEDRKIESIEKNAISFLFISKAYEVIKLLQEGIRPYLS
jgi:hypothetical protein